MGKKPKGDERFMINDTFQTNGLRKGRVIPLDIRGKIFNP